MVSTPVAAVNHPPNVAGSLIPILSQGSGANEDHVILVEPSDSAPQMDKGKQPVDEGLQRKRKRAVSVENDESIPREGFMANARCTGHKEKFFSINPDAYLNGWLADVADRCRQLPFRLYLPV